MTDEASRVIFATTDMFYIRDEVSNAVYYSPTPIKIGMCLLEPR